MNIGDMLRTLRERQSLSQYDLAHLSGVSRVQINKIERGYTMPRIDTLLKLFTSLKAEITINEQSHSKDTRRADRPDRGRKD